MQIEDKFQKSKTPNGKNCKQKNCNWEKQELTCNSTVIARPLLAHDSIFSSSKGKKKKTKIAEKRGQK